MINTISSIMPLAAEYSLDQNGSIVIWSFAILSAIIFLLTFLSDKWKDIWSNIGGEYDYNNMRRLFMFNKQPYMAVIFIAVSLLISAIIAGIFSRPKPFSRISWIPFDTRKYMESSVTSLGHT